MTKPAVEKPDSNRESAPRLDSILITLLLCFCLVILSIGVWNHVRRSEQPPLYDAISYMAKAKAFWDMVASGHWKNPLNLQPVMRPPGTILMSYPFGFSEEYKGFLARSVILPVFLFIAALYVAASRRRMSRAEHLDLAAVALILASLPCFYHFEAADAIRSPTYWGLVDSFLAAVAALAFATGYRAVQSGSWLLLVLASFLTGSCLMIKPAGVVVAMPIIAVLLILKMINDLNRPGGRLLSLELLPFGIAVSAGTGLLLAAAMKSHYLSRETISYGNQAVAVMRSGFRIAISPENLNTFLWPAFGLNVIVLGAVAAVAAIGICVNGIRARDFRSTLIRLLNLLLAASVLAVGIPFWLVYADLAEVRYYYPFTFISLVLLATFLLDALRGKRAPFTRSLLYGSAVFLFGGLTAMLYFRHIETSWQKVFAVNLTSTEHHDERVLADLLLRRAKTAERDLKVFAMTIDGDFGAIASEGIVAKVLKPNEPSFAVSFPVDWQRPATVHLKDLVDSEYILFHPIPDALYSNPLANVRNRQWLLSGGYTGNISAEITTIEAWLTQANEDIGLKELATGRCAIEQVVSPKLFGQSIAKWAATADWRGIFKSENSNFLKNAQSATLYSGNAKKSPGEGTELFDHKIAIDNVEIETVSPLIFGIDWRALSRSIPNSLFFFIHVLDSSGNIRSNSRFSLDPQLAENSNLCISHHTLLRTNVDAASGTLRYGFGIYQGPQAETLLTPDPAGTDFGGKRVIRELQLQ
jgi:hypothetical protein